MPSPLRLAADGVLAFAAGALALSAGAANAQSDPFALPKGTTSAVVATASGPGPSEIEVDGQLKARLVDLQGQGERMTIDADAARVAGLPVPDGATGRISLAALKLYRWSFDNLRQRLVVSLFRKADGANFHDFAKRGDEEGIPVRRTMASFRLDYVANGNFSPGGASLGAFVGASVIKGTFTAATSTQINLGGFGTPAKVTRLDSFIRAGVPGSTTVATLGDFTSKASVSQRAVRLGGIQLASDFSQQPNLITQPLPGFSGNVAVPTTLDVLTGNGRFELGKLEPGEFAIRNVPLPDGRGSMTVQLKDSLGRLVAQNVNFYTSASLLRPGLSAYAVNAGFVRRRYGDRDADYGPLVASAFYRRGLSPFLTLEGSAESTPGLLNLGLRGDFTVGNVALASLELRGSRDSRIGGGKMLTAALESIGERFTARLGATAVTSGYRDAASHLGDRPPSGQFFANISYRLRPKLPIQFAFVRQTAASRDFAPVAEKFRSQTISAGADFSPNSRMNVNFSAGFQDQQSRRSLFLLAGLTVRLGAHHSIRAGVSHGAAQSLGAVSYQFDDARDSGIRAMAAAESLNGTPRVTATGSLERPWGAVQSSLVYSDGGLGGQATVSGALVFVDGGAHALKDATSSYLLVRSKGVAGIPILLDNRFVGKTDASGKLFVRSVLPHATQRVDIDGSKLPNDAIVTASRHVVAVPAQAVGVLDIPAEYYRPIVVQVVDEGGQALAAGLRVRALPSGRETQVGFDGLLEFNSAGGDGRLVIETARGDCVVDIAPVRSTNWSDRPLVCRAGAQLVDDAGTTLHLPEPRRSAGRKVARRD